MSLHFILASLFVLMGAVEKTAALEWPEWAKKPAPLIYDRRTPMQWVPVHKTHWAYIETQLNYLQANNSDADISRLRFTDSEDRCPTKPVPGYVATCLPILTFQSGETNEYTSAGMLTGLLFANLGLGLLNGGAEFVEAMYKMELYKVVDFRNNSISGTLFRITQNSNLEYFDISLNSYDLFYPNGSAIALFHGWIEEVEKSKPKFCRIFDLSDKEDNCLATYIFHDGYPACGPPKSTGPFEYWYHGCPSRPSQNQTAFLNLQTEAFPKPAPTAYIGANGFAFDASPYARDPPGTEPLPELGSAFEFGGREYDGANPLPADDRWFEKTPEERVQGAPTSSAAKNTPFSMVSGILHTLARTVSANSVPQTPSNDGQVGSAPENSIPAYILIVCGAAGACVLIALVICIVFFVNRRRTKKAENNLRC